MDYEYGLEQLKGIAREAGYYQEILPYEAALREHLRDMQRYGPAPQTRQDLFRVVDQLNRFCLERLGISFNDLCLGLAPSPAAPPASLERPLGAIVCFYADEDEPFFRKLQAALSLWQRRGKIEWLEISAGSQVAATRQEHLRRANLVLLLCSASFFAEPTCHAAMMAALEERARRQLPVVPVLLRACAWEESACGGLKVLPENKQPVAEWTHADQAYESIRRSLLRLTSQS